MKNRMQDEETKADMDFEIIKDEQTQTQEVEK